jgi:hypothetical protein
MYLNTQVRFNNNNNKKENNMDNKFYANIDDAVNEIENESSSYFYYLSENGPCKKRRIEYRNKITQIVHKIMFNTVTMP